MLFCIGEIGGFEPLRRLKEGDPEDETYSNLSKRSTKCISKSVTNETAVAFGGKR